MLALPAPQVIRASKDLEYILEAYLGAQVGAVLGAQMGAALGPADRAGPQP